MCKRKVIRMKSAYPDLIVGDAIFNDMKSMGVPWADLNIDTYLDIMYYAHSANKIVSPIVRDFIGASNTDDGSLSQTYRTSLAHLVIVKYNDKWNRLWDLGDAEYDPLLSDTMTETVTHSSQHSKSGTDTGTVVTDHDRTDTGTVATDRDTTDTGTVGDQGSSSGQENIFGFNSSQSVGANDGTRTDANTETRNLASTDDTTETRNLASSDDITETRNLADSESGTESGTKTTTKSGRMGTPIQELIESERNVLQWNFWDTVFNDVDQILALDIY